MARTSDTSAETAPKGVLRRIVGLTPHARAARALEIVCNMAAALALAGTLAGTALLGASRMFGDALHGATLGGTIVIGGALVALFARWGELYGQRARDIEAQAIFETVRAGASTPAFTLYLRPFASTGAFEDAGGPVITLPALGLAMGGLSSEQFELEAQIERATRKLGRLVGLGAPLEHIGAGRVLVGEQEWREAVSALMREARLIIMLPSARAGTLEEIKMVLGSELVAKTVFLDPPNLGQTKRFDHAGEWKKVQDAFAAQGFDLPDEDRRGSLLFYGRERAPAFKERLHIDADDRIERLFNRVIKSLQLHGGPARA